MNQFYVHVNEPYAMLARGKGDRSVQLYKNDARMLLLYILNKLVESVYVEYYE